MDAPAEPDESKSAKPTVLKGSRQSRPSWIVACSPPETGEQSGCEWHQVQYGSPSLSGALWLAPTADWPHSHTQSATPELQRQATPTEQDGRTRQPGRAYPQR